MIRNPNLLIVHLFVLLLISCDVFAQSAQDLRVEKRKKFLDKLEVFGGPSLWLPNDHGWAEYLIKSSDGSIIYKAKSETGYQFGLSLVRSISNRFEIQGRISKVRVHYSEHETNLDVYKNYSSESLSDQKNDQIVISLVPTYFLSNKNRLHIFGGLSYAFLTQSLNYFTLSSGAQIMSQSSANTIDGFKKHVVNALVGVGYCYPINKRIEATLRLQGEYGLSYTVSQNQYSMNINGISLSIAVRYSR